MRKENECEGARCGWRFCRGESDDNRMKQKTSSLFGCTQICSDLGLHHLQITVLFRAAKSRLSVFPL